VRTRSATRARPTTARAATRLAVTTPRSRTTSATRVRPTNRVTTPAPRSREAESTTTPTDALQGRFAVTARLTPPLTCTRPLPTATRSCAANRATPTPTNRSGVVTTRREATPTPTDALASRATVTNRLSLPIGSLRPATPTALGGGCRGGCGTTPTTTTRRCGGGCGSATTPARRCGRSCGPATTATRSCGGRLHEVAALVALATAGCPTFPSALH
jgi:hypothetical protein